MSFAEVQHQPFAHRQIQQAIEQNRLAHAYIFFGPEGVGKEKMAAALAQFVLCPHPVVVDAPATKGARLRSACNQCEDCRAVNTRVHPDYHVIYRECAREHPDADVRKRKGLELSVDVIRHFLLDRAAITSVRGRAKVFIVRDADLMTPQAQNALLKTLEEPPVGTYIVLLTAALDALLETTLSRCQSVRFDSLPAEFIRHELLRATPDVPPQHLDWYARFASGSLGAALQAAQDNLFAHGRQVAQSLANIAFDATGMKAMKSGHWPEQTVKNWMTIAEALAESYSNRNPDLSDTEAKRRGLVTVFVLIASYYQEQLQECIASGSPTDGPLVALDLVAQAERQIDLNVNTSICVETLANELARTAQVGLARSTAIRSR